MPIPILLASSLSTTANSLYKLIDEYSKFTGQAFRYVTKKPVVGWYYTEANYACAREIKNIKGSVCFSHGQRDECNESLHG
jgi:hypothetical protein